MNFGGKVRGWVPPLKVTNIPSSLQKTGLTTRTFGCFSPDPSPNNMCIYVIYKFTPMCSCIQHVIKITRIEKKIVRTESASSPKLTIQALAKSIKNLESPIVWRENKSIFCNFILSWRNFILSDHGIGPTNNGKEWDTLHHEIFFNACS